MIDNSALDNLSPGRPLTIKEAALRLGVSERTVYRRLRSGKLRTADLSDMSLSDVSMTVLKMRHSQSRIVSEKCQLASDDVVMSGDNSLSRVVDSLREEIKERDSQIYKLIEAQRELNQTLQRLQEQMYELARLVLTQNAAKSATPTSESSPEQTDMTQSHQGLFSRLFGTRDKDGKRS